MGNYIIDTSIIIQAFGNNELRRKIILSDINLTAPVKLEIEVFRNKSKIQSRTALSNSRFDGIWRQLRNKLILKDVGQSKVNQAERILRDLRSLKLGVGLEDKHFFALALYLKSPYWTFEEKYWGNPSVSKALRARGIIVVPAIKI